MPKRALVSVFVCLIAVGTSGFGQTSASSKRGLSQQELQTQVSGLLQKMTLDEKIGQLNQLFYGANTPDEGHPEEEIAAGQIGSILFVTDPVVANRLQHLAVDKTRLHIPLIFGYDVIHGFHTIFPNPLGSAASWNPALIEKVQTVAAREARAAGVQWAFAPMVDIARDARWGRIMEGAGEDPYLGSAIAAAQVRGFQGPYVGSDEHVIACVKHFAGYGAAEGGRDYDSSYIPEDLLRNVYLRPFKAAVEQGVATLMSAYMDLNDVPATGNRFLLRTVLRDEWDFKGFVVSDAFAVKNLTTHGYATDPADAAFRAFSAGVNMDMGSRTYLRNLGQLVEAKRVTLSQIDDAVRPILEMKFRLHLFEHPFVDSSRTQEVFDRPDHRELARVAAEGSAVLLRNEGQLLPLEKDNPKITSLAVIGPLADSKIDTQGSWSMAGDSKRAVTIRAGMEKKVRPDVRVEFSRGGYLMRTFPSFFDDILKLPKRVPLTATQSDDEMNQAIAVAERCDLSVLVLGEEQSMSGEAASRTSLDLPGRQQELLERVSALGKPVVLVLLNGRPLNITWASQHIPAILEAWYPGDEGGNAVANLIFGDATPAGKLPVSWPRDVGQVPIYYAHNLTQAPETAKDFTSRYWNEPSTPLYPFGYGLSYTTFTFSNLRLDSAKMKMGGKVVASVDVENTGKRAGDEVAQLYVHQQAGSASRPVRELKGFERVTLPAGQKTTVRFTLGQKELEFWSPQEKKWLVEPEKFDVWVGDDSRASLHAEFKVAKRTGAPE